MYLFLPNMECSIYSWTYLVLNGLPQNRSHLPALLFQLSQLRRQISGRLDYSTSASSREKILTTVSTLTFMLLFCSAKALTQSTLNPQQSVSVQRFWTLSNPARKFTQHSALRCPRWRYVTCSHTVIVSRSSFHTRVCLPDRQSSTGNIDIPVPTLFRPMTRIYTSPTNVVPMSLTGGICGFLRNY
jgi:hypothetical protein